MFDEKFVKELPQDILKAQQVICEHFLAFNRSLQSNQVKRERYDDYLKALALANVFVEIHSLSISVPTVRDTSEIDVNLKRIDSFFRSWRSKVSKELAIREQTQSFETAKDYYASMFGKGVFYEFSDDDFTRVQTLLNNLRDLLTKSKDFEEEHRSRLLKRLEALQSELHKKMSDFDKFWGFFIDSGIALTKFWENAKPFRDDIKEIIAIVSRTQAKAENVQKFFPLNLLKSGDVSDSAENTE